jgi:hypothetical protein
MKNIFIFILLFSFFVVKGQTPDVLKEYKVDINLPSSVPINRTSSSLPPTNDDCSGAINLTVNGSCYVDSTNGSTVQVGENLLPCGTSNFTETVWYRFTATSTNMWVQLELLRYSGTGAIWAPTAWRSAIYRSNSCLPTTPISCQTSNSVGNGDGIIINNLTGLTVGATYYIQVGYRTGSGINSIPTYCISIGDQFSVNCNNCNTPCGLACGFPTTPTVTQVVNSCPPYEQLPYLEGSVADTQCYTFYAVNTTVSFGVIVNSTCQNGNVSNFSWNLYSSPCGAPVQSGTLSNLTFTGLSIGMLYRFCYSFSVPSNCYHTTYYPYFVGAAQLPIDLISFEGRVLNGGIRLFWSTASEINNDYFVIYKSFDGINYFEHIRIQGRGNSTSTINYEHTDYNKCNSIVYYKLSQVDYDGTTTEYDPIAFECVSKNPNDKKFTDILGRKVNQDFDGIKIKEK